MSNRFVGKDAYFRSLIVKWLFGFLGD